jgi:hypothetical protein
MPIKATCPKDPSHDQFVTVAHVTEDWVVDSEGDFIEVHEGNQGEVVAKPHPDNTWQCLLCGTEAEVEVT